MSEQARTPGVSPLEEALFGVIGAKTGEEQLAILSGLWRAAQVEALESVAKQVCKWCDAMYPREDDQHTTTLVGGEYRIDCVAWPIHEELARLRQSASAPDER